MIQINLLAHNIDRLQFIYKSINFLKKIKEENKLKIKVVIVFTDNENVWFNLIQDLNKSNIQTNYIHIPVYDESNYLLKIKSIVDTDSEYSCSMDDDILISNYLWDFIIENINVLDDEKNLFLSPLICNGIPSVDLFIEDFCNSNDKLEIKNIFLKTKIDNYWGVDYSCLNKERDFWDLSYYEDVKKINHYYKGIHPVRISVEAHKKISNIICNDFIKIISNNKFKIEKFKFPYFCNSFYFIKTSTWKKIIYDTSLFKDPYDEVPLNLFMQKNDLNMLFVRNGFCVHMAYNTIGTFEQKLIEKYYIENFINKI